MYHRARTGRHGNSPEMLDAHFAHIAASYPNVMPGDRIAPHRPNVCLSFDDGYFDFFSTVFPLLERHNLRALLAVPLKVVLDRVEVETDERLEIDSEEAFAHPNRGGFCTWAELAEMATSGRVTVAAHGFTHTRLDGPDVDLGLEVDTPKKILEKRLGQPIDSFVFPYGRFSEASLKRTKRRYHHVFRIGSALNRNWESRVLYRIDADRMEAPASLFSSANLLRYRARFLWNQLRSR